MLPLVYRSIGSYIKKDAWGLVSLTFACRNPVISKKLDVSFGTIRNNTYLCSVR